MGEDLKGKGWMSERSWSGWFCSLRQGCHEFKASLGYEGGIKWESKALQVWCLLLTGLWSPSLCPVVTG